MKVRYERWRSLTWGDAVYEILARREVCRSGKLTAGELHRQTIRYVSAPAQARAAEKIRPHLTGEEEAVYRRGRNAHSCRTRAATEAEYHAVSGLEALFGWLYLRGQNERIEELCYHFGGKQCLWTPYR